MGVTWKENFDLESWRGEAWRVVETHCEWDEVNVYYMRDRWDEEVDFSVWFTPIISWIYRDVQDWNTTCQWYEGCPKGGYRSVCNFLINRILVVRVETSRVGGWCCLKRGGRPWALIWHSWSHQQHPGFPHTVLGEFVGLGLPHVDMVEWR